MTTETIASNFKDALFLKDKTTFRTTIVGCGGTGSHVLLSLRRHFYADTISVFDPDKVEPENIGSQFFSKNHCSFHKVQAASKVIEYFDLPGKSKTLYYKQLAEEGAFKVDAEFSDLIIVCTNTMKSRSFISKEVKNLMDAYNNGYRTKCPIFIDVRIGFSDVIVYCIDTVEKMERYLSEFVEDDVAEVCGLHQVSLICSFAADIVTSIVMNIKENMTTEHKDCAVPFKVLYNRETLMFHTDFEEKIELSA
jgi:hypothetical protein